MPVSTSPEPPVAMPGLPVVLRSDWVEHLEAILIFEANIDHSQIVFLAFQLLLRCRCGGGGINSKALIAQPIGHGIQQMKVIIDQ
jgi:hypothetical protein